MSVLYISNVGQMACLNEFVWVNARREFKYTESIFIVSAGLESEARKLMDQNAHVIALAHPFHGIDYYEKYIDRILKTVVTILNDYRKSGMDIEEIVINTAGGTEKMSLIIKDCVEVLKRIHPNVRQIWGAFAGTTSIYTNKPDIDTNRKSEEILTLHLISKKDKVKDKPKDKPKEKEVVFVPIPPIEIKKEVPVVKEVSAPHPTVERKVKPAVKSQAVLEKERMEKAAAEKRRADRKREKAEAREAKRIEAHKNRSCESTGKALASAIKNKAQELSDFITAGEIDIARAGTAMIDFSGSLLAKIRAKFNKEYTPTSDEVIPE